jgi:hypothetical protein
MFSRRFTPATNAGKNGGNHQHSNVIILESTDSKVAPSKQQLCFHLINLEVSLLDLEQSDLKKVVRRQKYHRKNYLLEMLMYLFKGI